MAAILSHTHNLRLGLTATIDLYDLDPTTDYFKLQSFEQATFLVHHGVGVTGTATYTVLSASDAAGTGATATTFKSRVHANTARQSALTTRAAAGFTITAGSDQLVIIEVSIGDILSGKPYIALKCTEVVDSPVTGSIMCVMSSYRTVDGDFAEPF